MVSTLSRRLLDRAVVLPVAAAVALGVGGVLHFVRPGWARPIWLGALVLTGAPVAWRTLRGMLRGHFATDVVAMLAIIISVVLQQPVAGLVIVLMQTGGELLEHYAEGKASAAVRELEKAAPQVAHRVTEHGKVADIAADQVERGDTLLVRPGEMLPSDGVVSEGSSHLDEARITGESMPRRVGPGTSVYSGAVNIESAFHMRSSATARESLYARIVELVRTAQAEKSPIQRLADRYAVWFTPITLVVSGGAWVLSGDPVRALAVLVVATPCPLILATPVAIIGGINRAARRQIIVRTGAALEQIGNVDTAVFDKTGTLTVGHPRVARVRALSTFDESTLLALAGALEQRSGHPLARTTVAAAEASGIPFPAVRNVVEAPGRGVSGMVGERHVSIGTLGYVSAQQPGAGKSLLAALHTGAGLRAFVAVDEVAAGIIEYADLLREGLPEFFKRLGSMGVQRILLLSGDHEDNVRGVAAALGITESRGDLLPDQKVEVVKKLLAAGHRVLMTGDGTNDAPALSAATVGIALAAHGGGVTAEAADIVLLADDVTRVADAIDIGQRATRIARQSILVGLGLSCTAMVAAAMGLLVPTAGALLQEVIDVAVILNALRAGRAPRSVAGGK